MHGRVAIVFGGMMTVALMLAALWGWQHAGRIVEDWSRPGIGAWSIRCLAIGVAAGAQIICLTLVVGRLYSRDLFAEVMKLVAGLLCTLALVSAIALGLAGR
jgi:hypothetical protein